MNAELFPPPQTRLCCLKKGDRWFISYLKGPQCYDSWNKTYSFLALPRFILTHICIYSHCKWRASERESNINVWFRFIYSQKLYGAASLFPLFTKQNSTFMYLWAIYIFPGSVCLLCCSQIGRPIAHRYMGIGNEATDSHALQSWSMTLLPRRPAPPPPTPTPSSPVFSKSQWARKLKAIMLF